MINLECKVGPVCIKLESDAALHPEVLESLLTQVSVKTAIVYRQMIQDAQETGVLVVTEDD